MNNIVIFSEITTNDHLAQLKVESEKYTGLYVDMEDKNQRKYVKDKAADIKILIAKIERRRIDTVAEYKINVEKEAASITEDLVIANLPFTLLIDEYAISRKKALDAEKEIKAATVLAEKKEADHEFALFMDDKFDNDKLQLERDRIEYEKELKAQAVKEANEQLEKEKQEVIEREKSAKAAQAQAELDKEAAQKREELAAEQAIEQRKQDAINAENSRLQAVESERLAGIERQRVVDENKMLEENARLENVEHVRQVNRLILKEMYGHGLPEKESKEFIKTLARKMIPQLTINY